MSRDDLGVMVVGAGVSGVGPILHGALTLATNGRCYTSAAVPVRETGRVS
jgi:hypothetical protein